MDSERVTDKQLIARCGNGDEQAFEMLYQRYRRQLYSYLNKLVPGQSALADDLYQQTWIKLLKSLPRYRHQGKFLSWVFRVAHNLAIDHFRRESKQQFVVVDEQLPDPTPISWDKIDTEGLYERLGRAIQELPADQREVVLLRQQEISFKEIAEIQDASINTVLGRMHYAIKKLRSMLADCR